VERELAPNQGRFAATRAYPPEQDVSNLMASLVALSAAFCWGTADFLGGLQARRLPPLIVAVAGQLTGAVILGAWIVADGVPAPATNLILLAGGVGLINAIAFVSLYSALAIGDMSRVAPVLGTASIVPLVFGLAAGDHPAPLQLFGVAVAVGGVILLSAQESSSDGRSTVGERGKATLFALTAATCMGITLVGIKRVSEYDPFWAVFLVRVSGVALLAVMTALVVPDRPALGSLPLIPLTAIGALDVGANALWAVASTLGLLSLVAVLGTLFPAVTVLLAVIFLRERLQGHQLLGVVAVLGGGALISAG
jgi:drug/metabolite transporter (DMT)-like permease